MANVVAVTSIDGKANHTLVLYLDTTPIASGSLSYTRRIAKLDNVATIPVAHEIQQLIRELYAHSANPIAGVDINIDNRDTLRLRFQTSYYRGAVAERRIQEFLALLQEMAGLPPTTVPAVIISRDIFVPNLGGHTPQHEVDNDALVGVLNLLLARRG
jgi:hypothetical protein